jgi:hypothetical protein
MAHEGYYIDEQTFADLQSCNGDLQSFLTWLDDTEQKEAFVRLFPTVEKLTYLLEAIIVGNIPSAEPIFDAIKK